MNLQYLGDAYDYWKGSIFELLEKERALKGFRVDSLATDVRPWKRADRKLYARLLRIHTDKLILHRLGTKKALLGKHRKSYFCEIPTTGDLFFDPDTGIKTGRVRQLGKYLQPTELLCELDASANRVIVVYQHCRGIKTRLRVMRIISQLRKLTRPKLRCLSYESGTVALLFFSRERKRLRAVKNCLDRLLGARAVDRVFLA